MTPFEVRDVEYLSYGDTAYRARLYRPAGAGPFPIAVEVHGGAWTKNDRLMNAAIGEYLAARGVVVLSIDFRMPPVAAYPASLVDINFAIRWAKAHAAEFGGDGSKVGAIGTSSGGHQVLLAALRPDDARYGAIRRADVEGHDARLGFVISAWGVLDPLRRYDMAIAQDNAALVGSHHAFWGEDNRVTMDEGSPMRILERAEAASPPPALVLQGSAEEWTSAEQLARFAALWRQAGGEAEIAIYEGERHGFIRTNPAGANAQLALQAIDGFIRRCVR